LCVWQHPLETIAVEQDLLRGWAQHRQKEVRVRDTPASESAQGISSIRLLKAVSTSDLWPTEHRGESQLALIPSFST